MRLLILGLVLCSLSWCCAPLRMQTLTPRTIKIGLPDSIYAYTICDNDNKPMILINERKLNEMSLAAVMVHEMRHVYQAQNSVGGCFGFQAHYGADPEFRLWAETDAECAELAFAVNLGLTDYEQGIKAIVTEYSYLGYLKKINKNEVWYEAYVRHLCRRE